MKYTLSEAVIDGCECVTVEGLTHFDVGQIFDCGQCFRFEAVEGTTHEKEFSGVAFGRFVSFAQDKDSLTVYGSNLNDFESIWKRYLDLDRDYGAVAQSICDFKQSDVLTAAAEYGQGIRILSQDPFESVISFVISQNNNIPRIKKIIEALCLRCGDKIEASPALAKHASPACSLCSFPTAEAIYALGVDGLFALKTGFRAKYIYDAAEKFLDGSLSFEKIKAERDTCRAVELLCEVKGIGPKVASCALLFGFNKYDAFPVDVWMKKVGEKYFPDEGASISGSSFGEYAGIAQQYLFYYERYKGGE